MLIRNTTHFVERGPVGYSLNLVSLDVDHGYTCGSYYSDRGPNMVTVPA